MDTFYMVLYNANLERGVTVSRPTRCEACAALCASTFIKGNRHRLELRRIPPQGLDFRHPPTMQPYARAPSPKRADDKSESSNDNSKNALYARPLITEQSNSPLKRIVIYAPFSFLDPPDQKAVDPEIGGSSSRMQPE